MSHLLFEMYRGKFKEKSGNNDCQFHSSSLPIPYPHPVLALFPGPLLFCFAFNKIWQIYTSPTHTHNIYTTNNNNNEIERHNNGQKCDSFLVSFWWRGMWHGACPISGIDPKESRINKAAFNANWTIYANFIAEHFLHTYILLLLVGTAPCPCSCHMWQSSHPWSMLYAVVAPKRLLNQAIWKTLPRLSLR